MGEGMKSPDHELAELVDRLIDERIEGEDLERLKEMLRNDPAALDYCADRMRWSSELGSALDGFEIEVTEARRMVLRDRGGSRELVRNEGRRWRKRLPPASLPPRAPGRPIRWFFILMTTGLLALVAVIAWRNREPGIVLRNADFEQADLSDSLEPFNTSVLDWEDFFPADAVGTCNLERFTAGGITARSGDNAVRLTGGGLMQRLKMSDGSPVRVARGLRIRVEAWVHLAEGVPFGEMRFALRVVDSTFPRMRQFEPAQDFARVDSPGWQRVRADLWITERDLIMAHTQAFPPDTPENPIKLEGRSLALTIENRSKTEFFLDDVSARIVPDGDGEMKPFSFETPSVNPGAVNRRFDFWKIQSEGEEHRIFGVRAGETWLPPGRTQFAPPFHGEQVGFVDLAPQQSIILDSVPVGRFTRNGGYELRLALRPDDTPQGVKIDYQAGFVADGKELGTMTAGTLDPTAAEEQEVVFRLMPEARGAATDGVAFGIRLKFTARREGEASRVYFDNLRVVPMGVK